MPISNNQATLTTAVVVGLAASVALTMVLGRALTPAAFGYVALVGGVLAVARDMTELGSSTVAAARIAQAPAREAAILGEVLGLRLVLASVASLGCFALAVRPVRGDEQAVLAMAALVVLLLPLGTLTTAFQARLETQRPVLIGLAVQLVAAAACVALVLSPGGITGMAGAFGAGAIGIGALVAAVQVLREMATALIIWRAGTRRLGWSPRPRRIGRTLLRDIGGYGLASLCFAVAVQGSPVLVGMAGPEGALEAYAAAFRPLGPLLALPWILTTPLVPLLAALGRLDPAEAARRSAVVLRIGVGLGAVVVVSGHDFADAALAVLYGERFTQGDGSAAAALRWLSAGLAATIMVAPAIAILLARRRIGLIIVLSALCLAGTATGAALLLPVQGAVGMAGAVAGAITTVALLAHAAVAGPVWRRIGALPAMLLPAIGLATVTRLLPLEGRMMLLPGGVAFAAATWAACWLAGVWQRPAARVPT